MPNERTLSEATPQELNLELIRRGSFNRFNGQKVAKDLLEHRELWEAALMIHEDYRLISLRDLARGFWNVSTLFILPNEGQTDLLEDLVRTWAADVVEWVPQEDAGNLLGHYGGSLSLLRVWWD